MLRLLILTTLSMFLASCATPTPVTTCWIRLEKNDCRCKSPTLPEAFSITLDECNHYVAFPPESAEQLLKKLAEAQKKK